MHLVGTGHRTQRAEIGAVESHDIFLPLTALPKGTEATNALAGATNKPVRKIRLLELTRRFLSDLTLSTLLLSIRCVAA